METWKDDLTWLERHHVPIVLMTRDPVWIICVVMVRLKELIFNPTNLQCSVQQCSYNSYLCFIVFFLREPALMAQPSTTLYKKGFCPANAHTCVLACTESVYRCASLEWLISSQWYTVAIPNSTVYVVGLKILLFHSHFEK